MCARLTCIASMDIQLSILVSLLPRVLLSLSPKLAEAPPYPTSIPLPPKAIYSSKEELYRAIQAFASQYSYTFYIRRLTKINNSVRLKITEQIHGLSTNDTLIQHLKDKGIHFKINIIVKNRTRHLFITYLESIQLVQTNQDIILVDNTYKTNKFNMPLLYIIKLRINPAVIVIDRDQAQKNISEEYKNIRATQGYISYLQNNIRATSRAKGTHAYIKYYLRGKENHIPLDIDKKLYRGYFGVSISLPLQPYTGSFTRAIGLPYTYILNVRGYTRISITSQIPTTTVLIIVLIPASIPLIAIYTPTIPYTGSQISIDLLPEIDIQLTPLIETLLLKILKEYVFYIPRERRDLIGTIIAKKAN
ncbi:hypothetical protein F5882DRAFT_401634 [Hyaloscypha sp. PMI_1271]|nr:hypothetical protein F5882DRAFT_401634 [Hyaloscypha sp. PMI_1271]